MSQAKNLHPEQLLEEEVAVYLRRHPGYFAEHPELLAELAIPHFSGRATSLVERQVALLRERNHSLERQLAELKEVARENFRLSDGVHLLGLQLMRAQSLAAALSALRESLREGFGAEEPVLRIGVREPDALPLAQDPCLVGLADPGLALFADLLQSGQPRCGRIPASQSRYLFGGDSAQVASAALVPLLGEGWRGILAIGGREPERFQPSLDTLFLSRIGALASAALSRYLSPTAHA